MAGMFVWAHRGASARAPENTMAAFRQAETDGADGIELDVHLSRDGRVVVVHDDTLERTTDGRGPVEAMAAGELGVLDAGSWFAPCFQGEPLPLLEEVLAWAGERLRINVEIKTPRAGLAVLKLLRAYPSVRAMVSSFDHGLLQALRRSDSRLPLGFLTDSRLWRGTVRRAAACGAESVHPRHEFVSESLVAACRQKGLRLFAWTVDDPARLERLLKLGVDGVFSNDPGMVRRHLDAR
ncbi:glycerophosphodiester phosphodiesterase family protein [uncultured Desulfuromonas sp.]|uniref:glycerophosphodiester phosphodiesterase n=1 Tax=uncultured Desulfuromonas sp. TaxID=181013 RepID=UPI003444CF89